MERAARSLEDARRSMYDKHAVSILRAQECIELSLKAAMLAVGERYPTTHDVSDDLLRIRDKFPKEFREKVPKFALWSKIVAWLSGFARYGYERANAPASALFDNHDARVWVAHAEEAFSACIRFLQSRSLA